MKVIVNNKYTYETNLPVKVGDKVKLPGSWVSGKESGWVGTVTSLTSTYECPCKSIVGFVK